MCHALIMAGGSSSRMRSTHGPLHKSLVKVAGTPLLEWNLSQLIAHGFNDITIALNEREVALSSFIDKEIRPRIGNGIHLGVFNEAQPLGTIGAAGQIGSACPLLVVNVDNLTDLNLSHLVEFHEGQDAALTVASHDHLFSIPFGRLALDENNQVAAYQEKPDIPVPISSGTYVLGSKAIEQVKQQKRCDAPRLVNRLLEQNEKVVAYRHNAVWIDVNDAAALDRAESLVEKSLLRFGHSLEMIQSS